MARRPVTPAHDPTRTCVGCRTRATRSELLRVVAGWDRDGRPAVVPDPSGTASGRGAHLHLTTECFDLAVRRRAFTRALRAREALSSVPLAEYVAATEAGSDPAAHPTVIDRQETGAGSS